MYYLCESQGKTLRAYHNHIDGQITTMDHLVPDAYDQDNDVAYFFNGCYYHGHGEECLIKGKPKQARRDPKEWFETRLPLFKEQYPQTEIVILWECQWKEMMKEPKMIAWFNLRPWALKPPLHRLIPRDAVRGGHSETYNFVWKKESNLGEEFVYLDVISQYPDIALSESFPIGDFTVLIGKNLKYLNVDGPIIGMNGKPITGLIFALIEAPQNFEHPFLLHRTSDDRSVATLCAKCAEDQAISPCKHEDVDKFIRGTFTTVELNYALSLGYKIHHVFECWSYEKQEMIFQSFMQLLMRKKVMFSGLPKSCNSENLAQTYCDKVNARLQLEGNLRLTYNDISYDEAKKKYYKLLSCSVLGKIGQSNIYPVDLHVVNKEQLQDLLANRTVSDNLSFFSFFLSPLSFLSFFSLFLFSLSLFVLISAAVCFSFGHWIRLLRLREYPDKCSDGLYECSKKPKENKPLPRSKQTETSSGERERKEREIAA